MDRGYMSECGLFCAYLHASSSALVATLGILGAFSFIFFLFSLDAKAALAKISHANDKKHAASYAASSF